MSMSLNKQKVWANDPQAMFVAIMAQINVLIWGRATGKTDHPQTDFAINNIRLMPRSVGFIAGKTYSGLITKILPGILKALNRYGFVEGVHYWKFQSPPASLNIDKPLRPIPKYDYLITFFNGAVIQLISLDRGLNNGTENQWGSFDEARFFTDEQFREVSLTIRGERAMFGHLSAYRSLLITTDRPRESYSNWIYRIAEKANPERIALIKNLQINKHHILDKIDGNTGALDYYQAQLKDIDQLLNKARTGAVYYSEASTIDNAEMLGIQTIKSFKMNLSEYDYRVSVLNEKVKQGPNSFYPYFSESKHTHELHDYAFIDNFKIDHLSPLRDCRWDGDLNSNQPIDIALDYGANINWIVSGQAFNKDYWVQHGMYLKHPYRLKDLIYKWCEYHRFHSAKVVNYYYDHTAIARNAKDNTSYADEVCQSFRDKGWRVVKIYLGHTASPQSRFLFFGQLFKGLNEKLPNIKFNASNCERLLDAIQSCGIKNTTKGFEKDKDCERDEHFDQSKAPHGTDAFDTLILGKLGRLVKETANFLDTISA